MNRFQSWYQRQPTALRALLTINVAVYLVVIVATLLGLRGYLQRFLALNAFFPDYLYMPWQFVTYNFLHLELGFGGLLHIGFNMLWLYWIGADYEEMHGSPRLVALYLLTGIGGGVFTVLMALVAPGAFGGYVHGASASVLGLVTAVAILYPYKKIALFLFGTVRLIYVVGAFLALDLIFGFASGVAVGAHLGGALSGFLFAKAERSSSIDVTSWANVFFSDYRAKSRRKRQRARAEAPQGDGLLARLERWLSGATSPAKPSPTSGDTSESGGSSSSATRSGRSASEAEIDRILDKISEQGYDALSEEEKQKLIEASQSEG